MAAISRNTGVGQVRVSRYGGGGGVLTNVKVFGVAEALAKFGLIVAKSHAGVGLITMRTAQAIARRAKDLAPYRTGALKGGIYAERQALSDWYVVASSIDGGADVEYAGFQEYGTSKMAAKPFMRPATNEQIPEMTAQLKVLARTLERL